MGQRALGGAIAQHAGELTHAGLPVGLDRRDGDYRPVFRLILFNDEMTVALRGDLREVGDAEHLMALGNARHFLANHAADLAANVGIHLVEHQHRHVVEVGQHRLEREHDARKFAAGGDTVERQGRLADVG